MKKIIISAILLLAVSILGQTAGMAKAQEKVYLGDNRGYNSYSNFLSANSWNGLNEKYDGISRYASTIGAYIEKTDNGYMTVRIWGKNKVQISYFSEEYHYTSGKTIEGELPIWGGFYAGAEYYYLVWGQENQEESDNTEVIRVVKYDRQWRRQGAASLYGVNTVVPFDFGSLRMTEHNGYLYIRTAHKMYRSIDGRQHQANMTVKVREGDMKILDTAHLVLSSSYGYVSHSFNQFIMADDRDNIVALDHGDGAPRVAMLCTSHIEDERKNCYSGYKEVLTHTYYNDYSDGSLFGKHYGDNITGATIGGLEYSSSNYLTAGTSVIQDEKHIGERGLYNGIYNVYITVTERNGFSQEKTNFRWITGYSDEGEISATNPYLVKVSSDKFMLIWSEQKSGITTETFHYVYIDGEGGLISDIYTEKGYLSDCQPIAVNGNIVWYTMDNESILFYKINEQGRLSVSKGQFSENIEIYPKSFQNSRMVLTKIGDMTYEEARKSYIILDGKKVVDNRDYTFNFDLGKVDGKKGPGYTYKNGKIIELRGRCRGINSYFKDKFLHAYVISKNPKIQSVTQNKKGIKVTWIQEKGALGYVIQRMDKKGNVVSKEIDDYTVTSWTDLHVAKGMGYQYSIRAFTTDGVNKVYTDSSAKKKIIFGKSVSKGIVKKGEKYSDDEYTYKIIKGAKKGKKAQVSIVKYRGKEKDLYLGKKYVTLNKVKCQIVDIGKKAFYKNSRLKYVIISIPVKTISESAFGKCKKLDMVQINSSSLSRICKKAFMDSKKLKLLAIRTKKLTASHIGKDVVKGTGKKLKLFAPKKKYKQYIKILRKRGNVNIRYGGK